MANYQIQATGGGEEQLSLATAEALADPQVPEKKPEKKWYDLLFPNIVKLSDAKAALKAIRPNYSVLVTLELLAKAKDGVMQAIESTRGEKPHVEYTGPHGPDKAHRAAGADKDLQTTLTVLPAAGHYPKKTKRGTDHG